MKFTFVSLISLKSILIPFSKRNVDLHCCTLFSDVPSHCCYVLCLLHVPARAFIGAVCWGSALWAGRSKSRFPMESLEFLLT